MSFYNDYRPRTFSEVLGQDTITTILRSQVRHGNYHHSYLFFGASGTGKTSTARLLAAALNCEHPTGSGDPCGQCQSCEAVRKGRHWDLIEVDAARFRGINDIKELVFKACYAPVSSHKVYILDECHMLSEDAWNGLLKLLEEPPSYLVVIPCTTDFARIPETIASRCQLYPFKKLDDTVIKGKLETICKNIGVDTSPQSLANICQTARGNMRQAENTLEQLCCQIAVK